jgi:tripartite-type tricarboxylate transporter receptor subunit TctC
MFRITKVAVCSAALLGFLAATPGVAQDYPNKPVKLLVAFAPGGPADSIARIIGQKLNDRWKQSVVVENRGGAGGNIAAMQAAKADPDGYTILVTTSAFAVNPSEETLVGHYSGGERLFRQERSLCR